MSDLIRREDAIKALRCEYPTMPLFKGLREEWAIKTEGFRKAEEVIMSVPSADRPQGEWIVSDKDSVCSVCGKDEAEFICGTEDWYGYGLSNYCPNCGTRMKGADDETTND